MAALVRTPEPPYYAVIFVSLHKNDDPAYVKTADRMVELAAKQDGYLGYESARDERGLGITLSYWRDEPSIKAWKQQVEHALAQQRGKREWYSHYELRVAKVERAFSFSAAD